jgi:hypothetical protein
LRFLTGRPSAEDAKLVALVLEGCPPARTAELGHRLRAVLGSAPSVEVDRFQSVGADQLDGILEAARVLVAGVRLVRC